MSALPPKADIDQSRYDVCFVPKADSCTAANCETAVKPFIDAALVSCESTDIGARPNHDLGLGSPSVCAEPRYWTWVYSL
jgi:hypothetical protein